MNINYVLSWQATLAIFFVVLLVIWVFNAVFKMPKWATFLVTVVLTVVVRYYWWWISAKATSWLRFIGLDV